MKKTMTVLALSFAALAALSACSLNQDPYQEKSDSIKNGIPPELDREPPVPKPMASDALRLDSNDFYTMKEQVEGEVQISGRVLHAGATFELSIDNLQEFPGATFDPTSGVFKWTPPKDTTGVDYGAPRRLVTRITSQSPTGLSKIGTTKAILLFVTRAEGDPEIVEVSDISVNTFAREGEITPFKVTVKDPDSRDVDGMRPLLLSVPAQRGMNDISGLVFLREATAGDTNPKRDPVTGNWVFDMVIDLTVPEPEEDARGRDFTRSQETFKFGLQVTSRFGRKTQKVVEAAIRTSVMVPETSWLDAIEVRADQDNTFQFTVFDPYTSGKLTVNFITQLNNMPGGASGSCKEASRNGDYLCKIQWRPPVAEVGKVFDVEFEVISKSPITNDTAQKVKNFVRKFRVTNGVTGTPVAPNPVPAAAP